jgi:hypothetical protein
MITVLYTSKSQIQARVTVLILATYKIYRFVTMVYENRCHNSGHYPSSCLLFKTQPNSTGLSVLTGNTLRLRYEPNRLMLSIGL